jgi:hypothetical protein
MIRALYISGFILIAGCLTILIKGITLMQSVGNATAAAQHGMLFSQPGKPVDLLTAGNTAQFNGRPTTSANKPSGEVYIAEIHKCHKCKKRVAIISPNKKKVSSGYIADDNTPTTHTPDNTDHVCKDE